MRSFAVRWCGVCRKHRRFMLLDAPEGTAWSDYLCAPDMEEERGRYFFLHCPYCNNESPLPRKQRVS